MRGIDNFMGWIAIGAAASLAGMIWPFRRGTAGIAINMASAIVGAIAFGFASYVLLPDAREPIRLFASAVGSIAALLFVHGLWNKRGKAGTPATAAGTPPTTSRGGTPSAHAARWSHTK